MALSDPIATNEPDPFEPRSNLASWYTPGFSDNLGDRLLMFDNTSAPLELLRFKPEFADAPGFEAALRERVGEFAAFDHASFASARTVRRLGTSEGLALVSNHTSGRRLSDVFPLARGSGLASKLILRLAPALAALADRGPDAAHGSLTADRIIITPGGGLVIVEHVLGPALETLRLPPERLQSEFGLAVRTSSGLTRFDSRLDVTQLGLIALSLLVGRKVDATEDPAQLANLIDEWRSQGGDTPRHLLLWLERALRLGASTFNSARDAASALSGWTGQDAFLSERSPRRVEGTFWQFERAGGTDDGADQDFDNLTSAVAPQPEPSPRPAAVVPSPFARLYEEPSREPVEPKQDTPWLSMGRARWIIAVLAVLALGEAILVTGMWVGPDRTPPPPIDAAGSEQLAPAQPTSPPPPVDTQPAASEPTAPALPTPTAPVEASPATPQPEVRTGQLVVTEPRGAVVIVDGTRRATTPVTMTLDVGSHDVVMSAGGFETRQAVTIEAGKTVTTSADLPTGSVSMTAQPWANVWIDGQPLGRTPVVSIAVAIGTHDVLWRHPDLGERRQQIEVTTAAPLNLSMNLRQ